MKKVLITLAVALLLLPGIAKAGDFDIDLEIPSVFSLTQSADPCAVDLTAGNAPTVSDMIAGSKQTGFAGTCTFDVVSNVEWTLTVQAGAANWSGPTLLPVDNIDMQIRRLGVTTPVTLNGATPEYFFGDGSLGTGEAATAGRTYETNFVFDLSTFVDEGTYSTTLTLTLVPTS